MDDFPKGLKKRKSGAPSPPGRESEPDLEEREQKLRERELRQREKEVQKREAEEKAKNWTGIGCGGLVALALLFVLIAALVGGDESGDRTNGSSAGELVAPRATFGCPAQLFVGLPIDFEIRIKNPGPTNYPAAFVSLDDGFDRFVVNRVSEGGNLLRPTDVPGFGDTYVTSGGGIPKDQARVIAVTMTPIEAGNVDLSFWVWVAERDDPEVPDNAQTGECQGIPVNP